MPGIEQKAAQGYSICTNGIFPLLFEGLFPVFPQLFFVRLPFAVDFFPKKSYHKREIEDLRDLRLRDLKMQLDFLIILEV